MLSRNTFLIDEPVSIEYRLDSVWLHVFQFLIQTFVSNDDLQLMPLRRFSARRGATLINDVLLLCSTFIDLGSFQVFGIATDLNDQELSFKSRPVLAHPVSENLSSSGRNQKKLLQIEFETNPLDKKSDYRVKVVSQSLEIKYNAVRFSRPNEFRSYTLWF